MPAMSSQFISGCCCFSPADIFFDASPSISILLTTARLRDGSSIICPIDFLLPTSIRYLISSAICRRYAASLPNPDHLTLYIGTNIGRERSRRHQIDLTGKKCLHESLQAHVIVERRMTAFKIYEDIHITIFTLLTSDDRSEETDSPDMELFFYNLAICPDQ